VSMLRTHGIALAWSIALAAGLCSSTASAQGRILLGGDPRVPPVIQQQLAQIMSQLGPVAPTGTPPQPGDVAVIAEFGADAQGIPVLRVTCYDGVSAAPLVADQIPLDQSGIPVSYASYIANRVQNARAMAAHAAPPQGVPQGPMPGAPSPQGAPPPMGPNAQPMAAPAEAGAEPEGRPIAADLGVGMGLGMHQAALPTDVGTHSLPLSMFPALDVMLRVNGVSRHGAVTPGFRASYRTSVGYTLSETPPAGVQVKSPARTHELMLDAVVNVNFGDSQTDLSLPLSIGAWIENSRSDVELVWPRYTLGGPHARAELRIPLAKGDVVLTFGPDLGWAMQVSGSLQRAGIKPGGMVLGGEADLSIKLSARLALRAMAREAHTALASGRVSGKFTDMQRFITLGLSAGY
jgi:hypothetical protein